jgi:glyoxylase-like metal-dependent hydrolase (beta-lactamase superfamily II)
MRHSFGVRSFGPPLVLPLLLTLGCADITPLEDGRAYGPVVAIVDLFTSCFVLDTGDDVVLFDSCWQEGTLVSGLESQGFLPEQVTHVLMTHGHQDHAGGLGALSNAEVLALEAEQPNLTEHADDDGEIDRPVADGDELTFGDHVVHVLAVPGHTPGSAVYIVGGAVLLGDVAIVTGNGEIAPAPEDRSEDPAEAARALSELDERLLELEVPIDYLVPAHSGGIEGIEALQAYSPD